MRAAAARRPPGVDGVIGNWHSAAFSWDGEVLILGWEPGGGSLPECEATDPPVKKSAFFYDADTGAKLGQWTLPRPQSAAENCTIHSDMTTAGAMRLGHLNPQTQEFTID